MSTSYQNVVAELIESHSKKYRNISKALQKVKGDLSSKKIILSLEDIKCIAKYFDSRCLEIRKGTDEYNSLKRDLNLYTLVLFLLIPYSLYVHQLALGCIFIVLQSSIGYYLWMKDILFKNKNEVVERSR